MRAAATAVQPRNLTAILVTNKPAAICTSNQTELTLNSWIEKSANSGRNPLTQKGEVYMTGSATGQGAGAQPPGRMSPQGRQLLGIIPLNRCPEAKKDPVVKLKVSPPHSTNSPPAWGQGSSSVSHPSQGRTTHFITGQ